LPAEWALADALPLLEELYLNNNSVRAGATAALCRAVLWAVPSWLCGL